MKRLFYLISVIFTSTLLWCACEDNLLDTDVLGVGDSDCTLLDGAEGQFRLPIDAAQIESEQIELGDFAVRQGPGIYYVEQNDDYGARDLSIRVELTDGTTQHFKYRQTPETRASSNSMRQFYRNHGVGYSYNAVTGEYCNIKNFCCQILNRAVLDSLAAADEYPYLNILYDNEFSFSSQCYTSVEEYVQNLYLDAGLSIDALCVFGASIEGKFNIYERGTKESYLLQYTAQRNAGAYKLNYSDLIAAAATTPRVLTSSFRHAYSNLKTDKDIDDFLNTYGTHVVTYASLGARLSVTLQMDRAVYDDTLYYGLDAKAYLKGIFSLDASIDVYDTWHFADEDSKCSLEALGGDIEPLDPFLQLYNYSDFKNARVSNDVVETWIQSVKFDDSDLEHSNVELVEMDVVPIWYFIADEFVADRVKARVTGDIAEVISSFSDDNFINVSFPVHPDSVTCRLGVQKKQTYVQPDVVNYIYGGRYAVSVCHEWVPEITEDEKVYVAYPIYDGYVKLNSGLCAWHGVVYRVAWSGDHFMVSAKDSLVGDSTTMYMNYGVLSFTPIKGLNYQTMHPVVGCELPGSIQVDGTLGGSVCLVHKYFGHFYLDNKKRYTNIPGWEYTTTAPREASYGDYDSYFLGGDYENRMVQSDSYYYIYNPTEIDYAE
jgi:hypothetical protein